MVDWSAIIKEQESSAQGVREFCLARGLQEQKFLRTDYDSKDGIIQRVVLLRWSRRGD